MKMTIMRMATVLLLAISAFAQHVTMNVLFPPNPMSSAVKTYLLNNPVVSGVDIGVNWSAFDTGNGQYNFATIDAAIAPWIAAHKTVNLVVWAVSDSASGSVGNASTPAYVWTALGSANYVNCVTQAGAQRLPNYLAPAWTKYYQPAISAVMKHYTGNPGIGYIRFGLGHGGETIPGAGWSSTSGQNATCGKTYAKWGTTVSSWEAYLKSMLEFESAQNGAMQRMVGITPMGNPSTEVPDYLASVAVPLKIGFGSQGLESSDLKGCATTTADWCELFKKNPSVPHELQTIGQSCPSGSNCPGNNGLTGPLPPLLVFGKANGVTIFELYYEDWLLAFDPSATGYKQYGTIYASAIKAVAQ